MARYTAADRRADRAYYRAKSGGSRKRSRTTMGKVFRTRKGRIGCYKYVNGKRVGFVAKTRRKSYGRRKTYRRY